MTRTQNIPGEAAGLAGEAGLPGVGLLGLALKLGARVFKKSEEENIKQLGQYGEYYNIPCMMMKMDDSVFYLIDLKYLRSYTIHELLS